MSVQDTYSKDLTQFVEGQFTQQRDKAEVQSKIVAETLGIKYGRQTYLADTDGKTVSLPYSNQATFVLAADLIALDVVSVDVVVNGVATNVSYTFSGSHAASTAAFAALIDAVTGVATAVTGGTNFRTITATAAAGTDLWFTNGLLNGVTTGVTLANTNTSIEYGPSTHEERQPDSNGEVQYELGTAAGVLRNGYIAIRSDAALVPGQQVYIRFVAGSGADQKKGMATNAAGVSSNPTKAIASTTLTVETGCAAGGLFEARINK